MARTEREGCAPRTGVLAAQLTACAALVLFGQTGCGLLNPGKAELQKCEKHASAGEVEEAIKACKLAMKKAGKKKNEFYKKAKRLLRELKERQVRQAIEKASQEQLPPSERLLYCSGQLRW